MRSVLTACDVVGWVGGGEAGFALGPCTSWRDCEEERPALMLARGNHVPRSIQDKFAPLSELELKAFIGILVILKIHDRDCGIRTGGGKVRTQATSLSTRTLWKRNPKQEVSSGGLISLPSVSSLFRLVASLYILRGKGRWFLIAFGMTRVRLIDTFENTFFVSPGISES